MTCPRSHSWPLKPDQNFSPFPLVIEMGDWGMNRWREAEGPECRKEGVLLEGVPRPPVSEQEVQVYFMSSPLGKGPYAVTQMDSGFMSTCWTREFYFWSFQVILEFQDHLPCRCGEVEAQRRRQRIHSWLWLSSGCLTPRPLPSPLARVRILMVTDFLP